MLTRVPSPAATVQPATPVATAADRLSANCYFNALLRETTSWSWHDPDEVAALTPLTGLAAALRLSAGLLWLPVSYRSHCGRHQFQLPCWWQPASGGGRWLAFLEAVQLTANESAWFGSPAAANAPLFVSRVQASVTNLGKGLQARWRDLPKLFAEPLDLASAEQALLVGHSIHPTPKSRDQFSDEDAFRYAPEFGQAFALQWLAVAPIHLCAHSAASSSATELAQALFDAEPAACARRIAVPTGMQVLPAHPWQVAQLKRHPRAQWLFASGAVRELGQYSAHWRATSSLRSVYSAQAPYMLKFSLSVRLTNSLRTLQPNEMRRGLQVHQVKHSAVGRAFAQRCPQFTLLSEPAYLTLADSDRQPIAESLVLLRENPFQGDAARDVCVLATLTQDHPAAGSARVVHLIRTQASRLHSSYATAATVWFERFLDVVVEPLVIAQAEFGLLFGAHQQNLLLRFDGAMPVHGYFRDCQGTGYSAVGQRLLRDVLPELASDTGNLLANDMANPLFAYYLIVNSCFGVISAIATEGGIAELALLQQLRARLCALRAQAPADRSCLDYVLDSVTLWAKGNFRCALHNVNETTMADPLSVYHRMANPLHSSITTP